ncbi:hypothetical protein SteCoe_20159 [Stentor coeruleus]|uniref:ubiquitinyl hydrolase 1 n=1 Tax=Stentor coeruleus TaxID=5963 RepID=A0A1R2BSI7_9CILI|nr:hypothetical protein SteCoe_20159 [Stentor coeruleus]
MSDGKPVKCYLSPYTPDSSPKKKSLDLLVDSYKQFVIPSDWHLKYESYKIGGAHPGKIPTHLLFDMDFDKTEDFSTPLPFSLSQSSNTPNPVKYKIIPYHQWIFLSNTFGSDGEIVYRSKRSSFRSVSSGGYGDETLRGETSDIILPVSARRDFDHKSWKSSETTSKVASLDSDHAKYFFCVVSNKIGLEMFINSDGFNSALQLLFSIDGLVDYFVQSSGNGEFGNSEFLLKISMIFLTISYTHSGVIRSEFLFKSCNTTDKDPGLILQMLVNKMDIDLGNNNALGNVFNGVLTVENLCLQCSKQSEYQMKFNYLNLKPTKTFEKSLKLFLRTSNQLIFCNKCKNESDTQKTIKLSVLPHYFLIIFKRWEEKNPTNRIPCTFKRKLKLKLDTEYRLIGVIAEINKKYVCYGKRRKCWYLYDDEKYMKSSQSAALACVPYVLLYKKIN